MLACIYVGLHLCEYPMRLWLAFMPACMYAGSQIGWMPIRLRAYVQQAGTNPSQHTCNPEYMQTKSSTSHHDGMPEYHNDWMAGPEPDLAPRGAESWEGSRKLSA